MGPNAGNRGYVAFTIVVSIFFSIIPILPPYYPNITPMLTLEPQNQIHGVSGLEPRLGLLHVKPNLVS